MNAAVELGNSRLKLLRSDGVFAAWQIDALDEAGVLEMLAPAVNVVFCSVNPQREAAVTQVLAQGRTLVAASELITAGKIPLRIEAEGIGSDRVLGVVGALRYAEPPFMVADCGTATTITLVDSSRCIIGGYILPGLELQLDALHQAIPHLPQVEPAYCALVPGRTTAEAIRAGVLVATVMAIGGVRRLVCQQWHKHSLPLIITGGWSWLVADAITQQGESLTHAPRLVLEGALSLLEL